MTWKTEMLDQGAHLRDRAEAETLNVNEAHLIVHSVMARAFAGGQGEGERNLDGALTDALERWVDDKAA
jgi:hypothetical protein